MVALNADDHVPTGHSIHKVAPNVVLYVPAVQLIHVLEETPPGVVPYVPAPQLVQTAIPGVAL